MSSPGGHDDAQFYVSSDDRAMSALGHKQTFAAQKGMSALPPKEHLQCNRHVRFVPEADISRKSRIYLAGIRPFTALARDS